MNRAKLPAWILVELQEYIGRRCDRVLGVEPLDAHSAELTCSPSVRCFGRCWKARMMIHNPDGR